MSVPTMLTLLLHLMAAPGAHALRMDAGDEDADLHHAAINATGGNGDQIWLRCPCGTGLEVVAVRMQAWYYDTGYQHLWRMDTVKATSNIKADTKVEYVGNVQPDVSVDTVDYIKRMKAKSKELGTDPDLKPIHPIIRMHLLCEDAFSEDYSKGWLDGKPFYTFKDPAPLALEYGVETCTGEEQGTFGYVMVSW